MLSASKNTADKSDFVTTGKGKGVQVNYSNNSEGTKHSFTLHTKFMLICYQINVFLQNKHQLRHRTGLHYLFQDRNMQENMVFKK